MVENLNSHSIEDIGVVYSNELIDHVKQLDNAVKLVQQAERDVGKNSYPVRYQYLDRDSKRLDIYVTRKEITVMKGAIYGMYREMAHPVTEEGERTEDELGKRVARDIFIANGLKGKCEK